MRSENQTEAEFTMRAAGQMVRDEPGVPTPDERKLRVALILEEVFEFADAMSVSLYDFTGMRIDFDSIEIEADLPPYDVDWLKAVDACCDIQYVNSGSFACLGADDVEHVREVNKCNRAKFPDGQAIVDESGKYLKPDGWVGPNHERVLEEIGADFTELENEAQL